MNNNLRDAFQLDKSVHFLNHGSYGATPIEVFEAYQGWQRRLELQPVKFLGREIVDLFKNVRKELGSYLGTSGNNIVLIPNATFGVNAVARSLNLSVGDEVLGSDLEYGACNNIWTFLAEKHGFVYKQQGVSLPISSKESFVEDFWNGVTEKTKVIFLSHITSATALTLPIAEICARARTENIITVIDGAHAPGQLELDLDSLGADFYTANCHKWMCAPKGAAFLYAVEHMQELMEPLVVGWGLTNDKWDNLGGVGSSFLDAFDWLGTNDPASYLSIPAAIDFQSKHNWGNVRTTCNALLIETLQRIESLTGLDSFYSDDDQYRQLAVALLPNSIDPETLKTKLYDNYNIEVPITEHKGQPFVRVSIQGYNTQEDTDALLKALETLL